MKILFLTDNFPPEVNAPATRTYEHCREWVKLGAEVTVITGAPNFPTGKVYAGFKNRLFSKETVDGINVIRVWTYISANKGTIKRTLDYMSFMFSAILAGLFQKCDLIIGTTPQFFTAMAARRLAKIKKTPWVMEVRDIWPESIKVVEAVKDGAVIKYLEKKEKQCYDSARTIVCVTQGIHDRLLSRGIPKNKLKVFTNGANLELYSPKIKDTKLLKELGLNEKKVIGYIGTMGMAHKLDFILQSASKITDPSIHFLLIGEGAEKEKLLRIKEELALKNVTILNAVPKNEVANYLSVIDVALVNLKKTDLFLGALPSKIFENAAMEKPILLGLKGEAEKVIKKYKAGIAFEPENEDELLEKIHLLTKNSEFYMRCVEGCRKLAKDYNRKAIAKNMLDHIKQLDG